jgi:hypothetical protein
MKVVVEVDGQQYEIDYVREELNKIVLVTKENK